jgi:hypothetical protein
MNEPGIKEVLGTVKKIAKGYPDAFYLALQTYVDRFVFYQAIFLRWASNIGHTGLANHTRELQADV